MGRIGDNYLSCVVYLYPDEVTAEDGAKAGGSGFLVGVPTVSLKRNFWCLYAVTNKHVILKSLFLRLNSTQGVTKIIETKRNDWTTHPSGDDLAVMLLSIDPREHAITHVPLTSFLTMDILQRHYVGPGDDVFMVGRFVNHEGRVRNLPTARFGNIAQMPWEPVEIDGFRQESFLVEMRSIGGYSGSPVFVHLVGGLDRHLWRFEGAALNVRSAAGPWLLGVDWGFILDWQPVCGEDGKPINLDPARMQVQSNTGLAGVVPAWKLAEMLEIGPLARQREKIIAEVQARENDQIVMDVDDIQSIARNTPVIR